MRGLAVIPTYNEAGNLPVIVESIRRHVPELDILVVDDNSPDGTGKVADELAQASGGRVSVLHRARKEGLGRAYVFAFRHVLTLDYDFVVHMDADLSHDPSFLPGMIEQIENCDVVIGSRYIRGVNVVGWEFHRLVLSKFATLYVQTVTGLPLSDATSGFRCWRMSALRKIGLESLSAQGYLILVEMAYWAYRQGMKISEFPIVFYERRAGQSKVGFSIMRESALGVLALRFRFARYSRRNGTT